MLAFRTVKSYVTPTACLAMWTLTGCRSTPQITGHVEEIACTATFKTIESADERQRIYDVVRSYAERDSVVPAEVPGTSVFTLQFKVPDLKTMDDIDAHVRKIDRNDVIQQVLNGSGAMFSVNYDTITLTGTIKVSLTFKVDPGARLYIKPQGGREEEITSSVTPTGDVEYMATIGKGQDFLYARANVGGVDKYIKIDVHSGALYQITKAEYP
jgi:hypothetical protein